MYYSSIAHYLLRLQNNLQIFYTVEQFGSCLNICYHFLAIMIFSNLSRESVIASTAFGKSVNMLCFSCACKAQYCTSTAYHSTAQSG